MKRHLIFFCLSSIILIAICSCKKDDPIPKNDGSLYYQGNCYLLKQARLLRQNNQLQMTFYPSSISITELGIKGNGALLKLEFNCDSTHLKQSIYAVEDSGNLYTITVDKSFFTIIPESGTDTFSVAIASGQCAVTQSDWGNDYTFAFLTSGGDSIVGNYKGKYIYNNDTDGEKVGNVTIGSKSFDLQRGDLIPWQHAFDTTLYYYEFFMYSTNLRYADSGKIRSGLMFIIGLHSSNANAPTDGKYPVTFLYKDSTALFGNRKGIYDWGCYWYNYLTSTAIEKAFITEGEVTLQHTESLYHFTFTFKDQLGNNIQGEYNSDFNIITISQ